MAVVADGEYIEAGRQDLCALGAANQYWRLAACDEDAASWIDGERAWMASGGVDALYYFKCAALGIEVANDHRVFPGELPWFAFIHRIDAFCAVDEAAIRMNADGAGHLSRMTRGDPAQCIDMVDWRGVGDFVVQGQYAQLMLTFE